MYEKYSNIKIFPINTRGILYTIMVRNGVVGTAYDYGAEREGGGACDYGAEREGGRCVRLRFGMGGGDFTWCQIILIILGNGLHVR